MTDKQSTIKVTGSNLSPAWRQCPANNNGLAIAHKHPKLGWFFFDKISGLECGPYPHEKAALESDHPIVPKDLRKQLESAQANATNPTYKTGPVLVETTKQTKPGWAKCTDCSRVQRMTSGKLGLDPVHEHAAGGWYFYDKSWVMECGPYPTKEDARTWCSRFSAGESA